MDVEDPAVRAFKEQLAKLDRATVEANLEAGTYKGWKLAAAQAECARRRRYVATMPGEGMAAELLSPPRRRRLLKAIVILVLVGAAVWALR